jgi:hypothetical protein
MSDFSKGTLQIFSRGASRRAFLIAFLESAQSPDDFVSSEFFVCL